MPHLVVGGIVPDAEVPALTDAGVARIFGPGSSREEIVGAVEAIGRAAQERKLARGGFDA